MSKVKNKDDYYLSFMTVVYKIMQVAKISPTETQHTPFKNFCILDPFLYLYQRGKAKETNKKQGIYNPKNEEIPPRIVCVLIVPM